MIEIKLGDRNIPLFYSTYESIAINRDIGCTAFQLQDEVFGVERDDEDDPMSIRLTVTTDPVKTEKLGKLIRILGNAGLEEDGKEADLTDKWVLRRMRPMQIMSYALITMAVINEGNRTEVQTNENEVVDEGLEEQMAKKQPGS